jgi:DNA invertase Pin-like site-specific DNA recombinase
MDRLARNLDDLRKIVQDLTKRNVRIEFVKENLTFTGEDSPMAKQRGVYRGRKKSLLTQQVAELRQRAHAGEKKSELAREYGISRETLCQYLRGTNQAAS